MEFRLAIRGSKKFTKDLEKDAFDEENSHNQTTNATANPTVPDPETDSMDTPTSLGKRTSEDFPIGEDNHHYSRKLSIGATVKQIALVKHKPYQQDLVDLSSDGQASLFGEIEWNSIKKRFMEQYSVTPYLLPSKVKEVWETIVAISKSDNGFDLARRYLSKLKEAGSCLPYIKIFRIFETVFNILENQPILFKEKFSARITEYDYLLHVWGPLLKAVTAIAGNIVRLKTGESLNSTTTQMKQQQYYSNNSMGFKIDIRFVYDGQDDEYDVGAGEIAKDNESNKLYHDLGKLVREGKDVLDGKLHDILNNEHANKASAWIIQICGLQGQTSSIHLVSDGLYVAIPQFKLQFPSSISNLDSFLDTLSGLLSFVSNLESAAHYIQSAIETLKNRRLSIGKTFSRPTPVMRPNSKQTWIRPTWYTPPRNEQVLSEIPREFDAFESDTSDVTTEQQQNDSNRRETLLTTSEADNFGWIFIDKKWYNTISHKWSSCNPYE